MRPELGRGRWARFKDKVGEGRDEGTAFLRGRGHKGHRTGCAKVKKRTQLTVFQGVSELRVGGGMWWQELVRRGWECSGRASDGGDMGS